LRRRGEPGTIETVTYGPTSLATEPIADWRALAACSGYPNSLFFPANDGAEDTAVEKAKSVCQVCPVADECLGYALETNQRSGIWGGTTEKERKSLRRKWLAERRRSA
jgi:WhiB family redox-sensing transcriptional regulator